MLDGKDSLTTWEGLWPLEMKSSENRQVFVKHMGLSYKMNIFI